MNSSSDVEALDGQAITNLQMTWGQARDRGEWEVLKDCFQPDGTIHIAWISGSGYEFVDKSAAMIAEFKDGEYAKHMFGGMRIQLNNDRAYCQSHVNHVARIIVDDIEFDWEFWGQFHDLMERREDGIWRIFSKTMVYEKDRLDPVHAEDVPAGYFDDIDLSGFPKQVRFICWRLIKNGRKPATNLIVINSAGEEELVATSRAWLAEG